MTFEQIRATLLTRMLSFSGIEQSRVDYQLPEPSPRFTPPATGLWCRPTVQYSPSFMAGMADKPYTRKPGLFVVQCFARERAPEVPLLKLSDALETHFAYWSSGHLECLEATLINAGISDGFQQINVRIPFRAG